MFLIIRSDRLLLIFIRIKNHALKISIFTWLLLSPNSKLVADSKKILGMSLRYRYPKSDELGFVGHPIGYLMDQIGPNSDTPTRRARRCRADHFSFRVQKHREGTKNNNFVQLQFVVFRAVIYSSSLRLWKMVAKPRSQIRI